jgi:hypothetical protein
MAMTNDRRITFGESGEHLVVSRFYAHGLIAGQLPRGTKADDLYVELEDRAIRIQVKTSVGSLRWLTGTVVASEDRYFALVRYGSLKSADLIAGQVYLVPSPVVERALKLHGEVYDEAHPNQLGKGVPSIQGSWLMREAMAENGFGSGWLEKFLEPWEQFLDGSLI